MKSGAHFPRELANAVRARMELTRSQLLAANLSLRNTGPVPRSRTNGLTFANLRQAARSAPNVTLIGSIVLGALLLGPKRIVPLVVRTGLTSWITRNIRSFAGR